MEVILERETEFSEVETSNIELKEGDSYLSHEDFVVAVNNYAKHLGFQIRLGKIKKNSAGRIYKRTIFCSGEGTSSEKTSNIRNRSLQCCNCQFFVRASLNSDNGVWYIIALNLVHNHSMISPNFQRFMASERTIPPEIQERIMLLCHAGCNIPTIHSILKEEFSSVVTWIYNDLYNFVYQQEGTIEQWKLDANNFVKELENIKSEK